MTKIAVFGAGTWGIALARLLAVHGKDVTVWSAIPAELKALSTTHRHPNLPGMELPATIHYTADIAEACAGRDVLLFAVPSPFVRATAKKAAPHIPDGQLIVDVAKGVEDKTLMTMSEIIEDELAKAGRKARVVALSGPTHAEEVARDMPTAIVAACAEEEAAKTVQKIFNTPTFRVYTNDDRRGTELGGAIKNVIALAVGIALGLGYGDNAKAALITRGNAELARHGLQARDLCGPVRHGRPDRYLHQHAQPQPACRYAHRPRQIRGAGQDRGWSGGRGHQRTARRLPPCQKVQSRNAHRAGGGGHP